MDDYIAEKIESALWNINETLQLIAGVLLDGDKNVNLHELSESYERLREYKERIKEGNLV